MSDLKLNVEGAMKLMDERDALRAALQAYMDSSEAAAMALGDAGAEIWATAKRSDIYINARKALALGKGESIYHAGSHGKSAPHNQPSATSGLTASAVDDLLLDLEDYFLPRMSAETIDGKWTPDTEMKFWTRIKEVRGER